ncbi:hypothetical protein P43SY_008761 [Pythium insidiosum]|uniref:Uncharacterized protein n=1 Tax=Pythium insidiosum TaxID=114742 RepID=A0AAD5LEW7_PYTIN|nr:hypothetical protein P43SY_008761 [Pythium insidiosum]
MTTASPRELLPPWILDATTAEPPAPLRLVPWDDGFTPSGCDGRPGSVVVGQRRSSPEVCRVLDGAVDERIADLLYASAVRAKVWGVYVPIDALQQLSCERREALVNGLQQQDEAAMTRESKTTYREALATAAAHELLVESAHEVISTQDWAETHGVAVWVIASNCNDETEYHLDYAEMLRYETNVIFPPLYGATLHVSRGDIEGGGFHVNRRGLEHYREYGYKTRRQSSKLSTDALEVAATTHQEPGWTSVPYRFRRGIICDGDFPHFSGRVRALPPAGDAALPTRRVVVGFNLFPHAIGEFVSRYPEHSDAFNRYVKLSQSIFRTGQVQQHDEDRKTNAWSLETLKRNPKQAAFIKWLARKVREQQQKDECRQSQQSSGSLPADKDRVPQQQYLPHEQNGPLTCPATLAG